MKCPFCQRSYREWYGKWTSPQRQCRCRAIFAVRLRAPRRLLGQYALSRWEPIRRPWPVREYYGYLALLKSLFGSLRNIPLHHTRHYDHLVDDARELLPVCDLLRFWDETADRSYRAGLFECHGSLLKCLVESASNPEIEMPALRNLPQFHANCDFASWCLTQIVERRLTAKAAQHFGYIFDHFPAVYEFNCGEPEVDAAYLEAAAGRLPTARRAEVRARMQAKQ